MMDDKKGMKKAVKFQTTDKGTIVTYEDGSKEELEGMFIMNEVMEGLKDKKDKEG